MQEDRLDFGARGVKKSTFHVHLIHDHTELLVLKVQCFKFWNDPADRRQKTFKTITPTAANKLT